MRAPIREKTLAPSACPRCGFVSAGVRCPRCDALKLLACGGSCRTCKARCR